MELVGNACFFDWEVSLIIWLQAHMGSFGTSLASFISAFGEELACVAVIGFLFWCYDKRFGRFVGVNVLVGLVANPMIKNVFKRTRIFTTSPPRNSPSRADIPPMPWPSMALLRLTGRTTRCLQ